MKMKIKIRFKIKIKMKMMTKMKSKYTNKVLEQDENEDDIIGQMPRHSPGYGSREHSKSHIQCLFFWK